jgi:hypothetical protein
LRIKIYGFDPENMKFNAYLLGDVFGSSGFVERDDDEAAASADLNDDGQELGVDGAIVGVVRVASYLDLVVGTIQY